MDIENDHSVKVLTKTIKRFALEKAGFDLVGVTSPCLPAVYSDNRLPWGKEKFPDYLKDLSRRAHAEERYPFAKSVLSLAVNYFHPEDPKPHETPAGHIARYAYGTDYHQVIQKKLKKLVQFIQAQSDPPAKTQGFVDTGPFFEKAYAREAGLGFFGKHTMIITKEFGSYVFLATVFTSLELDKDTPLEGSCGSCGVCLDHCPTQALGGEGRIDGRKCISFITIESRGSISEEEREALGDRVFGCDVCQEVCPHNFRPKITACEEFYPNKIAGSWLSLEEIQAIPSDDVFKERFGNSALRRAKREGMQRNATAVAKNSKPEV